MGKVYVVHCIDTEGPLYESLIATFERVRQLTGVDVPPSIENLYKIQMGQYPLNGHEEMAKLAFSARFQNYNSNWQKLEYMLKRITDDVFREKYRDKNGTGWRYTWFVNDFIEYRDNPRERCMGFHSIWKHYHDFYQLNQIPTIGKDEFQWHTHAMTFSAAAHRNATSLLNSPHVWEVLARRIIDLGVFPECFRAGLNAERSDWNWFLEQYVPFDFSNQAFELTDLDKEQGLDSGRYGDWRRAPKDWRWYHPSHDDYQIEGTCHRWIFRCLNVGTRIRFMRQRDVDAAFCRAAEGNDTVLAFMDHDFRDIAVDIDETYMMIKTAASKYPKVGWINSTASCAAHTVLGLNGANGLKLKLSLDKIAKKLTIKTEAASFGPQPFFAIKTKGNRYLVDNLDFHMPFHEWTYNFDEDTIPLDAVEAIGVATNAKYGGGSLCVTDNLGNILKTHEW